MQEELPHRAEEYGASGEEGEAHMAVVGRLWATRTARETPVVLQEGPTAEVKKKDGLEKAAACRNRNEANRRFREQVAVGLEAAKRARLGGKEDGCGATSGAGRRPGRVKQVLPGIRV